ncbi:hypothetical protein SSX86_006526 [Deinandra increscens subsp. villosa]|uniref:DDT domain-containing protein n=1 Tax=Deinandra increscens subsp. villosa TaxID=3103831 RepID=A0AAP0H6W0_9ASTR
MLPPLHALQWKKGRSKASVGTVAVHPKAATLKSTPLANHELCATLFDKNSATGSIRRSIASRRASSSQNSIIPTLHIDNGQFESQADENTCDETGYETGFEGDSSFSEHPSVPEHTSGLEHTGVTKQTSVPAVDRGRAKKKARNTVELSDLEVDMRKEANNGERKQKKLKVDADIEDDMPIKYPIDDLLVRPADDDLVFVARPPPTRDFKVPMECVGDLLMIWDFCCSYSAAAAADIIIIIIMPLLKRKPFSLLDTPDDLKPEEMVFQIRFTKEIFHDYCEYLKRINLYRQRIWTCKSTGKSNLTYEEALVSEKQANDKFHLVRTQSVSHSFFAGMLPLRDLVTSIAANLKERLLEGSEIYARKNNRIYPCKIVKVIDDEGELEKTQYQVAWLDKDKKVTESAVLSADDLINKKLPFSRDVLKSFIRESTCRSAPWVLHHKLALKYGISTNIPQELANRRKRSKEANNGERKLKKLKVDADIEDDVPIKYPIDDLLVRPADDDPVFVARPPPTRDFKVPMECVGDLLMIWDFCCSYSKLLNLSPFSLDDFENAICYKDSNIVLIVECYSALLRLLMKDDGDYFIALQKKKRKPKISLVTWTDYMCDFLELVENKELSTHISTIRRGHYGILDIRAKLAIFVELVGEALACNIMREKLDEYIEERKALAAERRGEALEQGRKRRERKEMVKAAAAALDQIDAAAKKPAQQEHISDNSGKTPVKVDTGCIKDLNAKGSKKNKTEDITNIEQRKEYLEREMEKRFIRTNPLGKDRDYNRFSRSFYARAFLETEQHEISQAAMGAAAAADIIIIIIMPLLKRKPFSLLDTPDDLKPEEMVFQIRFTKEIFHDYCEYLKRINLYRQRIWTCKSTGKSNLTYEEALVSEKQANDKVQHFPKQLMEPVLRHVQFSMLPLRDLVTSIAANLKERLLEGSEIYARKNNRIYPCKIVKVIDDEGELEKTQYQVAWLDKDKKVTESAVLSADDLINKKLPFSRDVLKSFIRESTCRSAPWVLHHKLALKYGISTNIPQELANRRKRSKEANNGERKLKKLKVDADIEDDVPIKYPIDDLLVRPADDDPVFVARPPPTRDFKVPMECVGDLLMIWDFCCSYSKLLNLSPFSLDDFENAICYKDSNIVLIVECYSALLRLLMKDDGDYFIALQKKKRKPKISLVTWTDYMCDFLELVENKELSTHISTIRRGHYGILDIRAKLAIFVELVGEALACNIMREKLDEYIEERKALAAERRGEALEQGRKRRERKEMVKAAAAALEQIDAAAKKPAQQEHISDNRFLLLEYSGKTPVKVDTGCIKDLNAKGSKKNKTEDITNIEQRKEYLEREMEKRFIRTNPLGKDRDYNRYWYFRKDTRVFVESCDHKQWGYYTTKPELEALMGSLNEKGEREKALKKQLEKRYNKISSEMQKKSKEAERIQMEEEAALRRSSRVRAPPRENPARAFLKYVNKLKQQD